jgi:putative ABC transport system permease protein
MQELLQDLRYALRLLSKSPGFATIAIVTLALGIGANSAIFSMVNALLLHPYNFPELDRLVRVWESRGVEEGYDARWISLPDTRDLRAGTEVFADLATYRCQDLNSTGDESAQTVRGCRVSANFFAVLGVNSAFGRTFTETEERPGNDQVAIVSYGFWQQRWGGNAQALGKTLQLNGQNYNIVGVLPKGFAYPVPMQIWVPLAPSTAEKEDRAQLSFQALGRLKPGVTVAQARAALEAVSRGMQHTYPQTNSNRTATVLQLRKELYLFAVPLFGLLQAAAGFVLLLAGANLANLFFARMIARRREVAVRTALGASRGRLARLFLTEALVFSCAAGALAIVVSFWSVSLLRTSISPGWTMWVPGWDSIQVDRAVLAFTFLLSIFVGLVFGLATALRARQTDSCKTLKETAGASTGAAGRVRHALIVAQVMFALVLLICAAQTAQAFLRLVSIYQGFQPANVLRLEIDLPEKAYPGATSVASFYQRVLRASAALPGVDAASLVLNSPASNIDNAVTFLIIEKRPALKADEKQVADLQVSSPDYFQTLRIPLVAGRVYADSDTAHTSPVAVVSRSLARRFWPNGDALGQRIKLDRGDSNQQPWTTIVGIVEDVRQNWWNPTPRPTIYLPFAQNPKNSMVFLLRASSDPTSYAPSVREIVGQIDPRIAITEVNTLENEITDSIAIVRILGVLMSLFGGIALALASLGTFGILAESVARGTPEIGLRVALGACPRDIWKLIFGQAAKLCALGLAIGLPLAIVATHIMSTQIFGIARMNFVLFVTLAVILFLTTLAAGYLPARRAMRVDPMVALR